MEVKKSPKANLENKKFMFAEIGMIIALLVVFAAFEYRSSEKSINEDLLKSEAVEVEVEDIPITQETPPPPPEQPKAPVLSDLIDIVDDDIAVDDVLIITEATEEFIVDIMDYVGEVEDEYVDEEAIPFALVEEKPSFMGGDANDFTKWVNSKMSYPELARENGVQGTVVVEFTVNADGTVSNVRVIRGIDTSLDKEAVRVISSSPKWTPGRQRDKAVKVNYKFPVRFQLR